jgi:hypothetical protein
MRRWWAVAAAGGQLEVCPRPRYVEEDAVVAILAMEPTDLG